MVNPEEMSILIVDDFESMCRSIRGMLKVLKYGKKYRFAQNGLEALKMLKEAHFDLLILDWNMPVMTGVELLDRVRVDPALRDIPVIMVTAESNREIVAEAAESDIDAYILKPITVKSLGDRISAVLQKANNPPPMYQHLKKAKLLKESGQVDAAIQETKFALTADPRSSKPCRELGNLYYQKKDLNTAEKWFLKAAQMNKLDVFAFHGLGEIYLKRNDIDNAALYFEKAMKVSPRHISRGVYFGKILIQKRMMDRAEKVLDKAIELSGHSPELIEEIISHAMDHGGYRYAIKLMDEVIKNDPERLDILCRMGSAHESIEEPLNALKYYLVAERKAEEDVSIKMHIAKNYLRIGQLFQADRVLTRILKIDPENHEAIELSKKNV
ncbi:MAG: response regulator [Pseudomonadota bacterium]